MPQNPGNNTVVFNYPGVVNDRLHKVQAVAPSTFTQGGCNMQAVTVRDKIDNTQYSQATDKCLAPANTNTESVVAEWYLTFNGDVYRILGSKPVYDRWARLHHITFYCKTETPT